MHPIELYGFRPYKLVASGWEIREWVEACKKGSRNATMWLGMKDVRLECSSSSVCVVVDSNNVCVDYDVAFELRDDSVYIIDGLREVSGYGKYGYVKLKIPKKMWPPTVEINGIHMHPMVDVDPVSNAEDKVRLARVRRGMRVLDIGTGLGYTAIAASRRGAFVVTIEVNELVLWAAERNPYSWPLSGTSIVILLGDAFTLVEMLGDKVFDRVIHDPPRYSIAGDLYSADFYRELHRVLKPGGILYHYTGEPGRHSNLNIIKGVKDRLRAVGFVDVKYVDRVQGVIARKPRV